MPEKTVADSAGPDGNIRPGSVELAIRMLHQLRIAWEHYTHTSQCLRRIDHAQDIRREDEGRIPAR
jgi:hypothetical protein